MDLLAILQAIFYYPIFNVLMFLYWLVRDFGLSIVLLTVMVRLALLPMTFKQLHSQRKMMELQPQLNALKAQYGDDKQGFAKAQMQLMKENNVSMLGGCLPMLIQLPFLYGLFYALRSGLGNGNPTDLNNIHAINSNLYPFMKFASITLPSGSHPLNTFLDWFIWLPGHPALNLNLADPTHILPILAALFTFIQVRMIQGIRKPQQVTAGADAKAVAQQNAQQQTMSLMTYVTPVITLVFAWQYAAGLSLYWVVGTLFAIGQSYFIYGWGGLFKGIPRLDEWGARKNAEHEARREARLVARGVISAPRVVDSTLASSNGAGKNGTGNVGQNGARRKDWVDQAKGETEQAAQGKVRPPSARPFPSLMKPKETTAANPPKAEPSANGEATNGAKADKTESSTKSSAGSGAASSKGTSSTNTPRAGTPPNRRNAPPRSGSLPKPKGGKK
ncbi:MAG TPA: YidC/Oxa1 family membrane protein insertase [Ktedonobacterales bacterium]|nr:YidC/Oxa1 family membrane protein insertase [Ktedonobacterales bacterium]